MGSPFLLALTPDTCQTHRMTCVSFLQLCFPLLHSDPVMGHIPSLHKYFTQAGVMLKKTMAWRGTLRLTEQTTACQNWLTVAVKASWGSWSVPAADQLCTRSKCRHHWLQCRNVDWVFHFNDAQWFTIQSCPPLSPSSHWCTLGHASLTCFLYTVPQGTFSMNSLVPTNLFVRVSIFIT